MSRKELPRAGLVQAALAGKITNREGAVALHLTLRHFQRLKQRVREGGPLALRHQSRGRPSRRRLSVAVAGQVQVLLRDRYAGFIAAGRPGIVPAGPARPRPGNCCSSMAAPSRGSRTEARG